MLSCPTRPETIANFKADPCLPTSLCSTWKYARQILIDGFAKKLTNGTFRPNAFVSDENSMWSIEGGKLWSDAQNLAKDNQALGLTYMSRLIYKTELDLLTETGTARQ